MAQGPNLLILKDSSTVSNNTSGGYQLTSILNNDTTPAPPLSRFSSTTSHAPQTSRFPPQPPVSVCDQKANVAI